MSSGGGDPYGATSTRDLKRALSVRVRTAGVSGAAPQLQFPAVIDPLSQLSSLTDNRSSYAAVAKSCLALNQYAGNEVDAREGIMVCHDSTMAKTHSSCMNALTSCIQEHEDRRCRILACKTLAILARSGYGRIRHSPLLFSVRDGTVHRLEDEIGTDVPVALCHVALEDSDDGVSACAIDALGMLTLSSASMVGTLVEDELLRDVECICHARPSPCAPTLALLGDEDPSIPQMELQSRVFENVLHPRLWRLIQRILHYESSHDVLRTLPFLTACLVHLVKLTPSTTYGMDRPTYAKRWVEVDSMGLVNDVVSSLILPAMQISNSSELAQLSVHSALRLVHVCPHVAAWAPEVFRWSVVVLTEQLAAMDVLEHKMSTIATLLVAIRGVPLKERESALEVICNEIRFLPSTTVAPADVTCAGIQVQGVYRRPARVGFLTEVALSFFLDGPVDGERHAALKDFMRSPEVSAVLSSRGEKKNKKKNPRNWASNQSTSSGGGHDQSEGGTKAPGGSTPSEEFVATHVAEEFVLVFCQVAVSIGDRLLSEASKTQNSTYCPPVMREWMHCAITVLNGCSSCCTWRSRTLERQHSDEDQDSRSLFTMLTASQAWYIRLMHQMFYITGHLSISYAVSLHLLPTATPRHVLQLEDLASANSSLASYDPMSGTQFVHADLQSLADQFLEYKFRESIPSRHIRISLLSLLGDHWVQSSILHQDSAMAMNVMNARELLAMLSEDIAKLTTDLNHGIGDPTILRNYLDVCVAAIENIALRAVDVAHNATGQTQRELVDDSQYTVRVAHAALEGRPLRDADVMDDEDGIERRAMFPVCAEASHRIENASDGDSPSSMFSLLSTSAARDFNRRIQNPSRYGDHSGIQFVEVPQSAFVLTEEIIDAPLIDVNDDAHMNAYLSQYSQQIVATRADQSIASSSSIGEMQRYYERGPNDFVGAVLVNGSRRIGLRRAVNWLRLSPPPHIPYFSPHSSDVTNLKGAAAVARVACGGSVKTLSGGSDPISFVLGYSVRRCLRFDCEPQFKLIVTLAVHNITATTMDRGLRLDLKVIHQQSAFGMAIEDEEEEDDMLISTAAVYKSEIKPGDQVTWELSIEDWPSTGTIELHPSVTFREMESEHNAPKYVKEDIPKVRAAATMNGDAKAVPKDIARDTDDDMSKTDDDTVNDPFETGTSGGTSNDGTATYDDDEKWDMTLTGQPMTLSPMVGMQPCPLVFFRGTGSVKPFRFLWYQMLHRLPEMVLFPMNPGSQGPGSNVDEYAVSIAKISSFPMYELIDTVGIIIEGWAFMTLSGHRLLCIMIQPFAGPKTEDGTERKSRLLHFRSDNEGLLFSLMGSDQARNSVVAALTEGQWTCDTF